MSLLLVKFTSWDTNTDVQFEGFKIWEQDAWKKHLRTVEMQWVDLSDVDDEIYQSIDDLRVCWEAFDEYSDYYSAREISKLQAEMIQQATGAKEFGLWAQVDVD